MTTHGRSAGPMALVEHDDPVAAFWRAHDTGRDVALATSGTSSGSPRVIVRSTSSWVDSFPGCAERLDLAATSRFWVPGPLTATMNLFAACLATAVGAGWSREPAGCSHAQLTPSQLRTLLDAGAVPGLHALVAGDALQPDLRRRAEQAGMVVHHYYGAAELSLVAWGSDATDLWLVDQVQAEVRSDVLWVRSPWLARTSTDERGFASVGDLARLEDDHLVLLGRPGVATTAGTTVELAPIEAELQARARDRVVVLALPDARWGTVLCGVTSAHDRQRVQDWARAHLAGARRPRRWVVRNLLPQTSTGKIDRDALADDIVRREAGPEENHERR